MKGAGAHFLAHPENLSMYNILHKKVKSCERQLVILKHPVNTIGMKSRSVTIAYCLISLHIYQIYTCISSKNVGYTCIPVGFIFVEVANI